MDRTESFLTSMATTAKPRPALPARAASISAFKASRLVCWAMEVITLISGVEGAHLAGQPSMRSKLECISVVLLLHLHLQRGDDLPGWFPPLVRAFRQRLAALDRCAIVLASRWPGHSAGPICSITFMTSRSDSASESPICPCITSMYSRESPSRPEHLARVEA